MKLKRVLFLVSMNVERDALMAVLTFRKLEPISRFPIGLYRAEQDSKEIFLATTGVGGVNAGVITALCIEHFYIDAVIVLGIGGAINPHMKVGQIVIADAVAQHDSVMSTSMGMELVAPGELVPAKKADQKSPTFVIDPRLSKMLIPSQTPPSEVFQGMVISGSEYIGSVVRRKQLFSTFPNSLVADMESAGIAQVAKKLAVPFAVVKTIADEANGNKDPDRYRNLLTISAQNAAFVFRTFLQRY
jgi:adenosylhomocysteine nucleosidase